MTGKAIVLRGDALNLPLPNESVDLIVTSPPYFALRSYTDGGGHYDGQIGSEATPAEFLEALWAATAEMARVLKPTGSIFVNLGDKYAGSGSYNNATLTPRNLPGQSKKAANRAAFLPIKGGGDARRADQRNSARRNAPDAYNKATIGGARSKSLMGLPWRYAIGCIDQLDLILRAEIVWSKPNGLPESVNDRVRRSHEQWFHFTKEGRYFAGVDEIREPQTGKTAQRRKDGATPPKNERGLKAGIRGEGGYFPESFENPLGKLPGSVWSIPSEPLKVPTELGIDHFAAFPTEWPRRLILGWSPSAICVECGEGRRPVTSIEHIEDRKGRKQRIVDLSLDQTHGADGRGGERWKQSVGIAGYVCACTPFTDHPERRLGQFVADRENDSTKGRRVPNDRKDHVAPPTRDYDLAGWVPAATSPSVVLDPFGGTGTVALVAKTLDRVGISVDLSGDYCRLAQWRIHHSGHGTKALARTWAERQGGLAV